MSFASLRRSTGSLEKTRYIKGTFLVLRPDTDNELFWLATALEDVSYKNSEVYVRWLNKVDGSDYEFELASTVQSCKIPVDSVLVTTKLSSSARDKDKEGESTLYKISKTEYNRIKLLAEEDREEEENEDEEEEEEEEEEAEEEMKVEAPVQPVTTSKKKAAETKAKSPAKKSPAKKATTVAKTKKETTEAPAKESKKDAKTNGKPAKKETKKKKKEESSSESSESESESDSDDKKKKKTPVKKTATPKKETAKKETAKKDKKKDKKKKKDESSSDSSDSSSSDSSEDEKSKKKKKAKKDTDEKEKKETAAAKKKKAAAEKKETKKRKKSEASSDSEAEKPKKKSKAKAGDAATKTEKPKKMTKAEQRQLLKKGNPNPEIQIVDADPTFESQSVTIPLCCYLCTAKEAIRAVLTNNMMLLSTLVARNDYKSLSSWRTPRTTRRSVPTCHPFNKDSTGSFTKHTYGHYNIAALNVSRGGKEGKEAFLQDRESYEAETEFDNVWDLIQTAMESSTLQVATLNELIKLLPNSEIHMHQRIFVAVRAGNIVLAENLIRSLEKRGGFGFNALHYETLQTNGAELTPFKSVSVTKKPVGNSNMSPIHCAAINPKDKYLKALLDSVSEPGRPDQQQYRPIHYAATATTDATTKASHRQGC
ncbi:hypothetical protein SAMD00019534_087740 [Acytostelium subglobosum LB1]|uniref:hypothetical protein n=1 Tax=Acytostelium subglobosum LB1 TaxID=1410327 RepID=UPI000645134F|nr:hypothetical protein SAMD00019534_087740 [Acytostelium subglobosum LB1]GAM25599.1 hypothetical protein SAMD00019534_087740 [Acytostelium subglobosum LB1]|eukprot:XP_012751585.1 hypothetical protein SAMD00019534_087740 [Acytostelium subglobosum LB1]